MTDNIEFAPTELQLLKQRATRMGITYSNNISLDKLKAKINAKLAPEDAEDAIDNDADNDGHDDETGKFVDGNQEAADEDDDLVELPHPVPAALQTSAESAPAAAPAPVPAPVAAAPAPQAITTDPFAVDPGVLAAAVEAELARRAALAPAPPSTPYPEPVPATRRVTRAEADQQIRTDLYNNEMKLIRCRITNMDPKKKDLHGEILTVANEYLGTVRKFIPYGEYTDNGFHIPKCLYDQLDERKFLSIRTIKDRRTGQTRQETSWVREFALEILPE